MCMSAQRLPTSPPQSPSGALHGLESYTPPHSPSPYPQPGRLDQPGWCCPPTQSSAAPPSVAVSVSSASFHPPDGASLHPPVNTTAPQRKGHTKRRKFAFTLTRTRKAVPMGFVRDFLTRIHHHRACSVIRSSSAPRRTAQSSLSSSLSATASTHEQTVPVTRPTPSMRFA